MNSNGAPLFQSGSDITAGQARNGAPLEGRDGPPVNPYIALEAQEVKNDLVLPAVPSQQQTQQIENVDLTTPGGSLVGPEPTATPDGTSPRDVAKGIVQGKDDGVKTNSEAAIEQADKPLPAPAPKSRIEAVDVE